MAAAAEPILASTLWTTRSSGWENDDLSGPPQKGRPVDTSLSDIDTALRGGLDYGYVSCISAPPEARATNLVLALLATHLMSDSDATATVVDSTLAFDIRRLHGILVHRLLAQGTNASDAMKALDRLKIMKVFDFIGMTQAVSEFRDELEQGCRQSEVLLHATPPVKPRKGTISDSEGEEEELLEFLTPLQAPTRSTTEYEPAKPRSTMLVIDSISHLTLPLLKNSHAQAQSLLTSFLRSLSHLTVAHGLCTLLVNGTQYHGASRQAKGDPPSIFSSCTVRPALGQGLGYMLDLHLLVHESPRTAAGARKVYAGGAGPRGGQQVEMGYVMEVLQDRHGGRIGRWSGFTCAADGRLLTCM